MKSPVKNMFDKEKARKKFLLENIVHSETEFKKGQTFGNRNQKWKGDNVGYKALHLWVSRWRGKPKICEQCGKIEENTYRIHWANKSHLYKRDLSDWIRLCSFCHKKFDKGLIIV